MHLTPHQIKLILFAMVFFVSFVVFMGTITALVIMKIENERGEE